MQNKNVLIALAAVVIILILAAGGFLFLKYSKAPAMPKPAVTVAPTKAPTTTAAGTILGLLQGGKTESCSITLPDNKGTGDIVISDTKFAGNFNTVSTAGKTIVSHVVSDGTYIYMWSNATSMGIKMSLVAAKNAATNAQNNTQSVDINQNVQMSCGPWIADNSKFILPTTIKFTDMSKFFPTTQPSGAAVSPAAGTGANSSPCDQITNPTAHAACVNALNGQGQ